VRGLPTIIARMGGGGEKSGVYRRRVNLSIPDRTRDNIVQVLSRCVARSRTPFVAGRRININIPTQISENPRGGIDERGHVETGSRTRVKYAPYATRPSACLVIRHHSSRAMRGWRFVTRRDKIRQSRDIMEERNKNSHPTGIYGAGCLITEGCRGEGGILRNSEIDADRTSAAIASWTDRRDVLLQ